MNKTYNIQDRQGDVFLISIDKIPIKVKKRKSNVLVEGEATGHSHKLINATIFDNESKYPDQSALDSLIEKLGLDKTINLDSLMWVKAEQNAKLVHEEHGPIEIEVGFYIVIRQREYNGKENRLVLD